MCQRGVDHLAQSHPSRTWTESAETGAVSADKVAFAVFARRTNVATGIENLEAHKDEVEHASSGNGRDLEVEAAVKDRVEAVATVKSSRICSVSHG